MRKVSDDAGIEPPVLHAPGLRSTRHPSSIDNLWKQVEVGAPSVRCPDHLRDLLRRERARSDRTGGEFALVLFGKTNSCDGKARPLAPEQLALFIRARARGTDEVGLATSDLVCALLPGTTQDGARQFAQGVAAAVGLSTDEVVCGVYSYPSMLLQLDAESPLRQHLGMPGETRTMRANGDGHSKGSAHVRGNGHANANGNGNGHGNGNGNGNGHSDRNGRVGAVQVEQPVQQTAAARVPATLLEPVGIKSANPVNGPLQELFARRVPPGKRALDVVGAAVLLLVLSPLLLAIGAAVCVTSRGPVLFRQVRAGHGGRPFVLYKFRSMTCDAEAQQDTLRTLSEQDGPAFKIMADPRVTPLGRFIRKTSLDELPQIWNVLKGDMSLVGPRPLPWNEACGCELWQRVRLDVTPGITCIWQVEGRSRVPFAQWMRMDIAYIRSRSLMRDALLLVKTIPAVLFRRGAS